MAAQTSSSNHKTFEIPIETLPRIYWAIVSTSKSTESEWHQWCEQRLGAECILCGIKITGGELRSLATDDASQPSDNPKLERLRLKYCARNSCESRFYRVHLQPDSELHWTGIRGQLLHATPELRESRPARKLPTITLGRQPFVLLAVAGFAALTIFFLFRHFYYGYRIPVIQKKHEYRVLPPPQ